jgi:uncharacterized protein YjbJ (UPF0337 family)
MEPSTKDQAARKFHEAKGKVKEKLGRATDNPRMENEGQNEHDAGRFHEKIGQAEKVFDK